MTSFKTASTTLPASNIASINIYLREHTIKDHQLVNFLRQTDLMFINNIYYEYMGCQHILA